MRQKVPMAFLLPLVYLGAVAYISAEISLGLCWRRDILRGESGVFSTRFQSQFTQCSQILTGLYHIPYYSPY